MNNLSAWTDTPRFPRLSHAEWHGCTLADLIFPFFIFIVGVSTALSIGRRVEGGETNPLLAYCGAQIVTMALGVLYIGTPTNHTHLITIITAALFGAHWDVAGQTSWHDPRWPSLYWALIYLTFWTLLTGLLYRRRIFLKI